MMSLPSSVVDKYEVSLSNDVVDHAHTFRDWEDNKYHALGGKAPFCGEMRDHSHGNAIRVCSETVRTPFLEQVGHVSSDRVLILQVHSRDDILLNGRFVNGDTIFVSSGKTIHAMAKSPIHANILTIDKTLFFESLHVKSPAIRETLPFEHFIKPMSASTAEFHTQFCAHFEQLDRVIAEGQCAAHSVDGILAAAGEIVAADGEGEVTPLNSTTRAYIVDKSCELFAQNFHDEAFGVLDLCSRLRVSRRTLQYSFETVIGMSPSNYMRSVRLNIARHSLVTKPTEKIQGLALDAGFNHLGRFAKYYQEFFGELPSATVLRTVKSDQSVVMGRHH
ncbi:helix-turn-helix domain-containing protein [Burkholderia sp. BE12]|uniref:helix-turn-helix domain-containing protein n=1 Tax=Burkholderia sp. BE12 TaxID=2082394 RepID=UPI000CF4836E|nr:helix-turn-helix domain-containing protein [Burkholderia sp. BE12]